MGLTTATSLVAYAQTDYPINFDAAQDYTRTDRHLDAVSLTRADGTQTTIDIPTPRKVYTARLDKAFAARAGERVTVAMGYTGTWMNGYVYLDRGTDGAFSAATNDDGTPAEGSDLMAYSNLEGVNSNGESSGNGNVLNPPAFVVPADLQPGFYRMRCKVDWSSIDPAGRTEDGNGILKNGGALLDVRLNVHGDYCHVSTTAMGGSITAADGSSLNGTQQPFGEPLELRITPEEGYVLDGLRVVHGYGLDGDSLVHGTPQYIAHTYPAYLLRDNAITLPAEVMDGDVRIEGIFVQQSATTDPAMPDYALAFAPEQTADLSTYTLKTMRWAPEEGKTKSISLSTDDNTVYRDLTEKQASIVRGSTMNVTVSTDGTPPHLYLYVDLNNDGRFNHALDANGRPTLSGELLSYTYYNGLNSLGEAVADATSAGKVLPAFSIPAELPTGVYRARLKMGNNNIDPTGADLAQGTGHIVDLLLNVHNAEHTLTLLTTNGNLYDSNGEALPLTVTPFERLGIWPTAVADGYVAEKVRIRHGHHFDGPQYVRGNRQWSEYTTSAKAFTMPSDSVDGDVEISVDFADNGTAEYLLVFSDEFNTEQREQPDTDKWVRCQRQGATWNRWLSNSEEVIYLEDGQLVARAIPNPDQDNDPVPMITGGVKSMGKFGFTYGKVECRALNYPWTGNFPAIWMMPEDQHAGWPDCGEIDIWEVIDAQATSYHTIHSNWTYDLGYKNNPQSSFNAPLTLGRYHTYGFEWDETSMKWYVDGEHVGTYTRSTNESHLEQGQWPFDKHFHLILNQSVGNGSWAANADVTHTYETRFDWVRVYQKRGQENTNGTVGVDDNTTWAPSLRIGASQGMLHLSAAQPTLVHVVDLGGRSIARQQIIDSISLPLQRGIYIVNGQKVMVP